MIGLIFNPRKIPRTITRQEWKEIHRWRRVTQKNINEMIQLGRNRLTILGPGKQRDDLIDRMINPPVILGPYQDGPPDLL